MTVRSWRGLLRFGGSIDPKLGLPANGGVHAGQKIGANEINGLIVDIYRALTGCPVDCFGGLDEIE